MSWYKKTQTTVEVFYHATTPTFAKFIDEQGIIKPSLTLEEEKFHGYRVDGWNFNQGEQTYGSGVYLEKEKNKALLYARFRLSREVSEVEEYEDLYDDNYRYIALFTIYITDKSKLINVTNKFNKIENPNEFMYSSPITRDKYKDAWFEGPEWIAWEGDADTKIRAIDYDTSSNQHDNMTEDNID